MTDRAAFEAWITSPPFERDIERWPDDAQRYAWPGCYRDRSVDLAWYAWQDAAAAEREACAKLCEEMKDPWAPDLYEHACKECAEAIRARNATPPQD